MVNLWNVKDLNPPPVNRYIAKSRELDLKVLYYKVSDAVNLLNNQIDLHEEAGLLSRFIYKMKLKLRSDKGLKGMEKVNKALRQYLHINLLNVITEFRDMLPRYYEKDTYMPSRQMLVFILVRLQGLAKLLCRIIDTTKYTAELLIMRLQTGHLWHVAFFGFGMMSRINAMCRKFIEGCCKVYSELLSFAPLIEITGAPWLIDFKELPNDLKNWLNIEWTDKKIENNHMKNKLDLRLHQQIFKIDDSSDDDIEISQVKTVQDISQNISYQECELEVTESKVDNYAKMLNMCEDFGEIVETNEINKQQEQPASKYFNANKNIIKDKTNNLDLSADNKLSKNQKRKLKKKSQLSNTIDNVVQTKQKTKVDNHKKLLNMHEDLRKIDANKHSEHKMQSASKYLNKDISSNNNNIINIPDISTTNDKLSRNQKKKLKKTLYNNLSHSSNTVEQDVEIKQDNSLLDPQEEHLSKKAKKRKKKQLLLGDNKKPKLDQYSQETKTRKALTPKEVVNNINSVTDLESFIKNENKQRNKVLQKSLTKDLDRLQWSMIEKSITSYIKKCTNPTKACKFLKKSKEILISNLLQ